MFGDTVTGRVPGFKVDPFLGDMAKLHNLADTSLFDLSRSVDRLTVAPWSGSIGAAR